MNERIIDLTPSWRGLVNLLIATRSPLGRQEIIRLAEFADDYNGIMPDCVRQLEAAIECIDAGAQYAARGYIAEVLKSIRNLQGNNQ